MATDTNKKATPPLSSERVLSVDVLRGFDMFWIVGGGTLAAALEKIAPSGPFAFIAAQLKHRIWEGFTFEDLIFPLFVFLVGVSIVFSLRKQVHGQDRKPAYKRIARRFVLMFALGIFYYGGLSDKWPDVRIMGVLQRIALCYLFTSLLFLHLRPRGLLITCVSILITYWAWMSFVPVPGIGQPALEPMSNWAQWIDQRYLPGRHIINDIWDPEGILSTIPAIATCLLGVFAGMLLQSPWPTLKKSLIFMGVGTIAVVLGFAWGLQFPVIKKLWTSSYVLVAGGYSSLLLGLFILLVDVWKIRFWTPPFLWIGSNALAIYMAANIMKFHDLAERLVGGSIQEALGVYGDLLIAIIAIGLMLWMANFLHKNKIYIRV